MAQLVKLGDSQGIRIPKSLIDQAHLKGRSLKLQVVSEGLLITPEKATRVGWQEAIEGVVAAQGQDALDSEWLDIPLDSDGELEW